MTTLAKRITETPMAPYMSLLKGMSRRHKQIVVTYLTELMKEGDDIEEGLLIAEQPHKFSGTCGTWKDESDLRLDAALARFHKDWGGNKNPVEIANELRQGPELVNDVETW